MSPRRKQERKFVQPDTLELAPLCQRRKITETAQPPSHPRAEIRRYVLPEGAGARKSTKANNETPDR